MAEAQLPPPVEVEIWCHVGRSNQMYLVGTLEYPFPAPLDINDFLLDFASQILESRKPGQNAGTGRAS